MAITGALAAASRVFDPYPRDLLALDFAGVATGGRQLYKREGIITPRFEMLRGAASVGHAGFGRALVNGAWRAFAPDAPLIGDGGLGVWEAQTNILAAQNPTGAPWTLGGGTATASAAPSAGFPAGPWDYSAGLSPDVTRRLGLPHYPLTSGVRYTYRFLLRKKGFRYVNARILMAEALVSAQYDNVCFDLDTLSVAFSSNVKYTPEIYADADGRVYVSISAVLGADRGGATVFLYGLDTPPADNAAPSSPTSATDGFTPYYSELVSGYDLRGPPIWTTGLPATRPAVAQSVSGLVLPNAYVAFVDADMPLDLPGTSKRLISLNDASLNNVAQIARSGSGALVGQAVNAGSIFTTSGIGYAFGAGQAKAAIRVRGDGLTFVANGGALQTVSAPGPVTRIDLGWQFGSGAYLNGSVRSVRILPDMSDAELQALTA